MSLEARKQALLDLIEQDRQRQCAALIAQARSQAQALRATSRGEALQTLRSAFADERARVQSRLAAAQAELQTRRRVHEQRQVEALLVLAWQRLPQRLAERWRDETARKAWVAETRQVALRSLGATGWHVTHAEGWSDAERDAFARGLPPPQFARDAQLAAGLRIAAGGNVIDATLEGLIADRDEIGGRLIAALEHLS